MAVLRGRKSRQKRTSSMAVLRSRQSRKSSLVVDRSRGIGMLRTNMNMNMRGYSDLYRRIRRTNSKSP